MDRELLLEIGCEEIPASWLPALTNQVGEVLAAQLSERRLAPETPVETYSTPRRLTVRIARIPERQNDIEEVINGPSASAPEAAVAGFTAKHGIDASVLEKIETPKGVYLAYRKKVRGKTSVDVLPEVLGATLRALTFPKLMHWDAMLEDGKGELLFGRPIRWILYTYGGRVVPFTIGRTPQAQTSQVQEVNTGAATYGHRFLTTSGRAGRAIKVRSFDEYRARLLENFVILERSERHNRIASQLDAKAQRRGGRVSRAIQGSELLHEVPDLVEYPSVVSGVFPPDFLALPEEVLTTTLIHHQHYFPIEDESGKLKNAFLAVINIEPDNEQTIARNAERVVTARLRDASFFWEADRKATLESRIERLSTLLFHKKLGSYKDKALRIEKLADWISRMTFHASNESANHASIAARLAKTDLATDMVREFPELQGIMGGVYARKEGLPEDVWKAIYYHYLPQGVEVDAPPSKAQLGKAWESWAAVSLADKFDTVVGLFAAGEKPTGSRDPFGLRRAGHGIVRILVDVGKLPPTDGGFRTQSVGTILNEASRSFSSATDDTVRVAAAFLLERFCYLAEVRGFTSGEIRAVRRVFEENPEKLNPHEALRRLEALRDMAGSADFIALAELFKRVKNITKDIPIKDEPMGDLLRSYANDPTALEAERALASLMADNYSDIFNQGYRDGVGSNFKVALTKLASFRNAVSKFFDDVIVMAEDERVRKLRLWLVAGLRDLVIRIADISEMVAEEKQA